MLIDAGEGKDGVAGAADDLVGGFVLGNKLSTNIC
jgi:hypothetical protein